MKQMRNYSQRGITIIEDLLTKRERMAKIKNLWGMSRRFDRRKDAGRKGTNLKQFRDSVPLRTWSIGQCGKRTTAHRERLSQSCSNICTR
jgi:hypothetical protein